MKQDKIEEVYDAFANWYNDDGSYDTFLQSEAFEKIKEYAAYLAGASDNKAEPTPERGNTNRWVKASERLPPIDETVIIRDNAGTVYADKTSVGWDKRVTDYEWLDESSSPNQLEELRNRVKQLEEALRKIANRKSDHYCQSNIDIRAIAQQALKQSS